MSKALIHSEIPARQQLPYWLITVIFACLIPIVTNVLLPLVGIDGFQQRLGPTTLPTLITVALSGLLYIQYLQFTLKNPLILAIYSVVFIRLMFYAALVLETTGKHLPTRMIHIVFLIVPCLLLLFQNFKYLNKKYQYLKYLLTFFSIFLLYFIFFNLNFIEPTVSMTSGTSISQGKLNDYFYTFVGIVFVACAFQKAKSPEEIFKLFRTINRYIVIFALVHGLLILLGYPLDLFTMAIEGFKRSTGLYSHPNELGKAQGLLLIYFTGLYYYYYHTKNPALLKDRMMIGSAIVINILAFFLSLSKNSFAAFGLVAILFFGLSLFDPKLRRRILSPLIIFTVLMFGILLGYQTYTGNDLLAIMTDRINDTRSLQWRYTVWGFLLGNIDGNTLWFGHGLTASNMELYRFLFDTSKKIEGQSIYVHNAFISFLYDMGIWGLSIFTGFFVAIYHASKNYFNTKQPLFLTAACLALFSIVCSLTDESITDLNASLLCWFFITMIFSLFWNNPNAGQITTRGDA